jgi:capsular polysaccharide biosynthesis protein
LAQAVSRVLQSQNANVFPQLGGVPAQVLALDEPVVALAAPGWSVLLALPLRVLAGLGVGVLLAFGAHYLDPHLRTRSDAEQLGLTVLGQIPRRSGQ